MTSTLTSIQAGTSTNPTSVQNATYQYDLMGNVTQRQDGKRSLTENYAYGSGADNLYRLASTSVLGGSTMPLGRTVCCRRAVLPIATAMMPTAT